MSTISDHEGRIVASLLGAQAARRAAVRPVGADDMLAVAETLADTGEVDVDDLSLRGLDPVSEAGPAATLLRVLPFGLATPLDRPRVRREAYRHAAATGRDEGIAVACVIAALLAADLLRFDVTTTRVRVRQSLLEDAPFILLDRLIPLPEGAPLEGEESDPGTALQLALTALERADSVAAVLEVLPAELGVARALAGALAGVTGGMEALDGLDRDGLPDETRLRGIAARLVALGAPLPG